ncbi:lysoplasmalogenase [Allomuricauda sp. NBRC 101325]|uniref:lysoplasmalogenase n=1 Tax=Allomuricauda sp. NBRC 101325 TaxID=1113758 RepID=UPI0024A05857|nr:lysoplasmalogenase [Muricauda sp. NBRC 101325]GLU43360.1 membrane protein [Muricauda sp. NBRC 101325]
MVNSRLVINVLFAVSALTSIVLEYLDIREGYVFFKPFTTFLAIVLLFSAGRTSVPKFKSLMLAALVLCLVGDTLLLFESYFVFGLASFLLGHLLFIAAFIQLKGFYAHWVSFFCLMAIGGGLFLWLKPDLGDLLVPVSCYILVICVMAWQGIGLYVRDKSKPFLWIAMAVLLFMFSDSMIAVSKFKMPFAYASALILSTYWLSVGLLANATYQILSENKG